jgi:peptidoglycan/LPS O-acetylase OafA/YrhL
MAGWMIMAPADFTNFGRSLIAAAGFGTNFLFMRQSGGYFDRTPEIAPLLHTWSLAVEEQFYFV